MKNTTTTLIFLWLCHFFVDFQIGIYSVYKSMVHLDLAIAGSVGIFAAILGEGCQAIFGSWSDAGHQKKLLAMGMLFCISSSLMAYTVHCPTLLLLLLCTFIGSAAFHPSAAGIVGALSRRKGLFIGIFASGGALGLALSQICFYHAYHYLQGSTSILALPLLLLSTCLLFVKVETVKTPSSKKLSDVLSLFKRADFRSLYYVQLCNQTLYWGMVFLLPDVLSATGYSAEISFGGGHLAFIAGSALMMIPGGVVADRYSPKVVIIAAMAGGVLFFYSFLFAGLTHPFIILSLLVCLGACFGVVSPLGLALGYRLLPSRPSLVSAFVMGMVWCISESLAPASGILTKLFAGDDAPIQALTWMGLLNIAGLLLAFRLSDEPQVEATVALNM